MSERPLRPELDRILRGTSRSFYLTLRVVPRAVRSQLGLSYLFCRAADTIADTRLLPPAERLAHLATYRAAFASEPVDYDSLAGIVSAVGAPLAIPEERELLEKIPDCFRVYESFEESDRALIEKLVTTLTEGMQFDLETFPGEESGQVVGLSTDDELDQYCYWVAGCVGEFWTDLTMARLRALRCWDAERMRELGIRFGKGLQMTNILRDVDGDLRIGRCYLPRPRLDAVGASAESLYRSSDRRVVKPMMRDLVELTLEHYRAGWEYTLSIPRRLLTLRLACIWPLWIGLRTLELLLEADDPCAQDVVRKISRKEVGQILRRSSMRVFSNRSLDRRYAALEGGVKALLERL